MRKFFLTVGYSGLFPKAPGTMGSLVSVPFGVLILYYTANTTLMLLSILITVVAIKQIDIYEQLTDTHDDKIIVIDELVGMWIALALSGGTLVQIVLSFIFYRYFDIVKPSIIGKIDNNMSGGKGVMLDDVVAGFFAGLLSSLVYKGLLYFALV